VRYDEDMTQTAPVAHHRVRQPEMFAAGDRVIVHVGHTSAETLTTIFSVINQHDPRAHAVCGFRDCGRYYLTNSGDREVRACELKRALALGEVLAFRVGTTVVRVQCVRLDASYHVTAVQNETLALVDLDSSWPDEISARAIARANSCLLIRETV
jgi:hypothetical protein